MLYKIPLVLTAQEEGGYTVTSPILPEMLTEGDTVEEALENARDALDAVVELYEDLGKTLPNAIHVADTSSPVWLETLVSTP
jgi:antitoxin HicB